jgi:hypothetical protein
MSAKPGAMPETRTIAELWSEFDGLTARIHDVLSSRLSLVRELASRIREALGATADEVAVEKWTSDVDFRSPGKRVSPWFYYDANTHFWYSRLRVGRAGANHAFLRLRTRTADQEVNVSVATGKERYATLNTLESIAKDLAQDVLKVTLEAMAKPDRLFGEDPVVSAVHFMPDPMKRADEFDEPEPPAPVSPAPEPPPPAAAG